MKIVCDAVFLDGKDRFEAGETRIVDDARAAYFCAQGWAHEHLEIPVPVETSPNTTLDIQSAVHAQGVTHG